MVRRGRINKEVGRLFEGEKVEGEQAVLHVMG
jgi:hypothetical protein